MIDLRSDTVTMPSGEMREVMASAEVGDDVYGEDPSINSLQELASEEMGKEAALFVPSGTMGNLVAHMTHCQPGDEVIISELAHSFVAEAGGAARIAGLSLRTIPLNPADFEPELLEDAIRAEDIHFPRTGLIWIEQPTRGYVWPLSALKLIHNIAQEHGVPVHMDGARIYNGAAYLGARVQDIAERADSVMFCLSKGLACPVGSVLTGSEEFICRARKHRKILGGEMRQAGIVASAGLHAIPRGYVQARRDHANAQLLADGIRRLAGVRVDREEIQTNIFFVELASPNWQPMDFVAALKAKGVMVNPPHGNSRIIRLVTHYGLERDDILDAITAFEDLLGQDS